MPARFVRRLLLAAMVFSSITAWAGEITVSAAASLTDAFKEIVRSYEAQSPGAKVLLNFGASGALMQQIAKGAPVDVFASADQATMDQAQKQNLIAERQDFTRNALVLILPADSPLSLGALGDLRQTGAKRITLGNPAVVPAGRYAKRALEKDNQWAAVEPKIIYAQNVRQALDYVARGEVDAGFVFATDAAVMKDKVKVALNVPVDVPMTYPIGRVAAGANSAEAQRFIAFVMSPTGQDILARSGFLKP